MTTTTPDLCERLRRYGDCAPSCADGSICYEWNGDLFIEAAAELEALRKERDALRKAGHLCPNCGAFTTSSLAQKDHPNE